MIGKGTNKDLIGELAQAYKTEQPIVTVDKNAIKNIITETIKTDAEVSQTLHGTSKYIPLSWRGIYDVPQDQMTGTTPQTTTDLKPLTIADTQTGDEAILSKGIQQELRTAGKTAKYTESVGAQANIVKSGETDLLFYDQLNVKLPQGKFSSYCSTNGFR